MATLNQHIYSIRGTISRGESSDDSPIQNSLIIHYLNLSRATLLKQRMDKFDDISQVNYQPFCVTLQDSDPTECSLPFTLPEECRIRRSTVKIPQRIPARWGEPTRVQYLDGRRIGKLGLAQFKDAKFSLSRPDKKASYFFQENYLYILGNKVLSKVRILDLFEDPTDANNVSVCAVDTENWPIDSDLIIPMYQLTLQSLGIAFNFPPADIENNAREDVDATPAKT